MVTMNKKKYGTYLKQHCDGQNHMKEVAKFMAKKMGTDLQDEAEPEAAYVPCRGISFADDSCGPLLDYYEHFQVWLSWLSDSDLRQHKYIYSDDTGRHEIKAGGCRGTCKPSPPHRSVCDVCRELANGEVLRRQIMSSALRKFAVDLLRCRLFEPMENAKALVTKWSTDVMGIRHTRKLRQVIDWKTHQLQAWVKSTFDSIRHDRRNPVLREYVAVHVDPLLEVNVAQVKQSKTGLVQAQAAFEKYLNSPGHDELERLQVAMAQASLNGKIRGNPLLSGLLVACLKLIQRSDQGKSLAGRGTKNDPLYSAEALDLAREAGSMLALAGGSKSLLKQLGMSGVALRAEDFIEKLSRACLPVPFLALNEVKRLRENVTLIDQRLSSFTGTSGCNLLAYIPKHFKRQSVDIISIDIIRSP